MTKPGEIFGRPQLLDLVRRDGNAANLYVTNQLLRASTLLQLLPWREQNSLEAVYRRQQVARVGQLRALNSDYAAKFAQMGADVATKMAIIGDAFEWDRVLGAVDIAAVDRQIAAMAPGIANRFSDLLINGAQTKNSLEFNGLSAVSDALGGDAVQTGLDLTLANTGNNLKFRQNYARVSKAIRQMVGLGLQPVVIGNSDVLMAFELAADTVGTQTSSDFYGARAVQTLHGAPLVDAGMAAVYDTPRDEEGRQVHPVLPREVIPTAGGTTTDLYVVGLGQSGVCGLTLDGFHARSPVRFASDKTAAGAIHRAEVEMVAGVAVLDERAIVKFSDVKLA